MYRRMLILILIAVIVLAVTPALAQDDDEPKEEEKACWAYDEDDHLVAIFCDGRLNATDMMAPVAIYYRYETRRLVDDDDEEYNAEVPVGIELWTVSTEGVGQLAAYVPYSECEAAMHALVDSQIMAKAGLTLNYSVGSDMFWVTGPGGYSFEWEVDDGFSA